MASSENNNYSSLRNNWADLPIELLTDILDKVSLLQDYIRFGGVCKSWYFVSREQKLNRHRRQLKEPSLLHTPVADNPNQRALYSVSEGKIYNYRFSIPYRKKWCGASHGWLAIPDEDPITKDLYITLFNPLYDRSIQLPPIMNNLEIYRRFSHENPDFKILSEFQIHKVILSCDPFLYPDDYVVAVIYDVFHKLSWLKSGQRSWNLGVSNQLNPPYPQIIMFGDIFFRRGFLYGITFGKTHFLFVTDLSENGEENKYFTYQMRIKPYDLCCDKNCIFKPYIVESSTDNVLLIQRIQRIYYYDETSISKYQLNTIDFKIYQLKWDDWNKLSGIEKWIDTKNLEKDDVLFLGPNNSVCIPASSVPNCKSNSIYYTDEYTTHSYYNAIDTEDKDMGVFHLEDRSWEPLFVLDPSVSFMSPAAWISPTLN